MDITEATFHDEVVERSRELPVVVDFWAEWCGPCRQLAPLIEAAVARHAGEVALAKVDIDSNPGLATAHRIMSIPAVMAFRHGAVVDEFVGLQSPEVIDRFVARLVPSPADRLAEAGDEDSLRRAIDADAGHVEARLRLGRLLIADGRHREAQDMLRPVEHDRRVDGLLARLELRADRTPDVAAALAALDRGDLDAALLAFLDAIPGATAEGRERIQRAMVGIFTELGELHPLTTRFRRRLARALY